MVSALDSGSSGPGSRPGRGHFVVSMGKTLNSHSASLMGHLVRMQTTLQVNLELKKEYSHK